MIVQQNTYFKCDYKKSLSNKNTLPKELGYLEKSGAMLDIEHWSPHDLRRTVRTGLARLGCPNEVGEAILGHSKKGIEGTYNLHTYDKECKIWLQKWADYLDDLLTEQK